jgi:hypothetical protein
MKPNWYQLLKEFMHLRLGILGDTILTGHNCVDLSIHQSNNTAWTVKECSIQNKVAALPQIRYGRRRNLFQVVIDHSVKLPRAMVALVSQLSGRVTFNDPEPEPFLLFGLLGKCIALVSPATRVPTERAIPALFSLSTMTVSPENT